MGKHEPMTAKAIANKIKAKGLQKIKYYCEMCKKQCRDDNGFKCHIMSESHQRQALVVSENPEQFVNEFSKQFQDGFMYILKTRYRTKRVLANSVFQEYIKDREHIHLNGTRWTSLTEFANDLGERGLVTVDDSERGIMVTYIDKDPETLRRLEIEAKRAAQAKEAAIKEQIAIKRQMEATKKAYQEIEREKPLAEPVPIITLPINTQLPIPKVEEIKPIGNGEDLFDEVRDELGSSGSCDKSSKEKTNIVERPLFSFGAMSIKASTSTSYKPPPPKRKIVRKGDTSKRLKSK